MAPVTNLMNELNTVARGSKVYLYSYVHTCDHLLGAPLMSGVNPRQNLASSLRGGGVKKYLGGKPRKKKSIPGGRQLDVDMKVCVSPLSNLFT